MGQGQTGPDWIYRSIGKSTNREISYCLIYLSIYFDRDRDGDRSGDSGRDLSE